MAQPSDGARERFPSALLAALRAEAPEGSLLRFGLWNGETVVLRCVLRETDEGVVGEVQGPPGTEGERAAVVAVPWHAIARVEAGPAAARRARPGFRPEA